MAYTQHGHHIPGTIKDEERPASVARCGGPPRCGNCADGVAKWWASDSARLITRVPVPDAIKEDELNDYDAVTKVYDALWRAGLSGPQVVAALNEMYGAGVIFRLQKD